MEKVDRSLPVIIILAVFTLAVSVIFHHPEYAEAAILTDAAGVGVYVSC